MSRIKTSTRLLLLVGVLSALLLASGMFGLLGIHQSNDALKTVYEDRTVAIGLLADIQHQLLLGRLAIDASVLEPTPQVLAKSIADLASSATMLDQRWNAYLATLLTPDEARLAATFSQDRIKFQQEGLQPAITALRAQDIAALHRLILGQIRPLDLPMQTGLEALVQIQLNVARAEYTSAEKRFSTLSAMAMAAIAAGLLFAGLGALALLRTHREEVAAAEERKGHADVLVLLHEKQQLLHVLQHQRDALQESEFRWQFAIEGSGDGVWDRNIQTDEEKYSRRYIEMLGYTEEDIGSDTQVWQSRIHPEDRPAVLASDKAYMAGEVAAYSVEYRLRCKDGSYKWILSRGMVVSRDPSGQPVRSIGTHTDITERKSKDVRLLENLATLRLLDEALNQISQGVMIAGPDRLLTHVNTAAETITGYSLQDLLGRSCRILQGPDTDPQTVQRIRTALATGQPFHGEILNYRKDGTTFWNELSIIPVRDPAGVLTQFVGVQRDVSERKKSELAQKKAQTLLQDISQRVPGMVYQYRLKPDGSSCFPYASDAIDAIYRVSPQQALENAAPVFATIHPQDYDDVVVSLQQSAHDLTPWVHEYRVRFDDGTERWLLSNSVAQREADGGTLWHGFVTDISERKQAEAQLLLAQQAAETANLAKSRFLATMSHEIRTPMNGILGMAQVLMEPGIAESDQRDYARTIYSSGQTLLALLNDILDLSKIEAGKVDLETIAMEPAQVIHETQALFAETARAKGLHIAAHWSGPARRYLGDPHRLRQMLSNLVSNALKFTSQGSIRIEAREVQCAQETATLEFSVTDSGVGIAPAKQALLFQTFSQADSSITRSYGGTGLGLSIVRSLALAMGGEVGMQSEVGRGSRFRFSIRAERLAGATPGPATLARAGVQTGTGTLGRLLSGRVLVIEDNPVNQRVIVLVLGKMGLNVVCAGDGQQGLDLIMAGEPVDLILMDLQMPVLDGYDATAQIRQREAKTGRARCPIIALTANAYEEDRQRCLAVGMDGVLTKPIVFPALRALLARWLPEAPSSVAAPAPPASTHAPLDEARIMALVAEIMPMLAQNQFAALARIKALQDLLAGTVMAPEVDDIGRVLQEFRFDLALDRLRRMAATYHWEEPVHD